MADAYSQYQQPPPRYYLQSLQRLGRSSPPRPNETPSPSQSPAPQSPANALNNFFHPQQNQHNAMMAGQGRLQMHGNLAPTTFKYQQQQQPHQHIEHNLAHVQNSSATGAMGGPHQHAFSTVGAPGNAYNAQQHTTNGANAQPPPAHWQQ